MAIPDEYTSLVKLDAYIGTLITTRGDKTRKVGELVDFKILIEMAGLDLERVYTGWGGVNDCLIHAFLHSTCPNFRMLDQPVKDRVAYALRRSHIQNIARTTNSYKLKTLKSQINMNADLSSTRPLPTDVLTVLTDYYGIKILVFELMANRAKAVKTVVIYGAFVQTPLDTPTYMIYNPGVGHFESVRTLGGEYTIPYERADFMRDNSQGMGTASEADIASARAANAARGANAARAANAPRYATPASVAAPAAPAFSFTPVAKATPANVAVAAEKPEFLTAKTATISELQAQLDAAQARVEAIKARIAAKKAGKGGRRTRRRHA